MGLVELMSLSDTANEMMEGKENVVSTGNTYEFTLAGSADEVTPALIKGDLDMACVPANLAAVLYGKTGGAVEVLAVNTLGVLYIVENGETVQSMADLKGQTIVAAGKGSTPEYALRYLLTENGIDPDKDVTIDWKSEHSECVAALASGQASIALLPQPFVTVAQTKIEGLRPHIKDTAKILYGIYLAITLLEIVILCALGMPLFESLLTSFGTTGTGGFGFRNDSFASFSPAIQNTVTTFMILSGINYTFYFCILSRRIKDAFRIEEVRWYLFLIFASVGMITYNIRPLYANTRDALRNAFFQVGAIITTTGYSTADFDMWPALSQTILVTLMFVGACAGSTGGGMKVSRLVILFKTIRKELSLIIHPREIRKIRMDGHVVEHSTLRSTNVFLVIYFILLMLSTLIISLDEFDFTTNFTAVVSCLNNIGPGLNRVGPAQNFSIFSPLSKVVLIFDMLAGRLELFPLMILFMPSTWRKK